MCTIGLVLLLSGFQERRRLALEADSLDLMARFNPHLDTSTIYPIAQQWVADCLVADRSLFSGQSLWTASHIEELVKAFVQNPILTPDISFLEKLERQLSACAPEVKRLMAEILYVVTLFQSNMRPTTKQELVSTVWSWSGTALPADHPLLEAQGAGRNSKSWARLFNAALARGGISDRTRRGLQKGNRTSAARHLPPVLTILPDGLIEFRGKATGNFAISSFISRFRMSSSASQ